MKATSRTATLARIVVPVLFAAACGKPPAPAAAPAGEAGVAPAAAHGEAAPAAVTTVTGTVLETMDSGGYTYLKLKTAEGETWAAVNEAKVAVGETVSVVNPMTMTDFESATLGRKFPTILFGTLGPSSGAAPVAVGLAPAHGGAGESPAASGPTGVPPAPVPAEMAAQHAQAAAGPEVTEKISVAKAEGADGRTVAELWAQRAALKGKTVAVRGKVVKYNGGIMGKNWIHLRDGSGSAEKKDHDLTVTTQETVAKGDVVLVRGVVAIDRDFGSGYTYAVLVEDAKVTK